jgi:Fur family ferric uptake transcriptional regulator
LQSDRALSHADIETAVGKKYDRVTIYRALQAFLEKGLIHSIPSLENSPMYALCKDECCEGKHFDNHAHFICTDCGKTYCLDDVVIPNVKLPKGFVAVQRDLILNGKCGRCQ